MNHRLLMSGCVVALLLTTGTVGAAAQSPVLDLGEGVQLELVEVPAGQFLQGSPADESGRESDELQHSVTLTRSFFLGKTPVTVGQFRRFVAESGYRTEAESGKSGGFGVLNGKLEQRADFNWQNPGYLQSDDYPVTIITFQDALEFLKWLSRKTGRAMRLPTESEWEFACRGGTTTPYFNGNQESSVEVVAWYQENAGTAPKPVGKKLPNAFGLHDMSGNIYEWCQDIYDLYSPDPQIDPLQQRPPQADKERRVLRGGSWMRAAKRCRSAARYRVTAGTRNAENGFRVATFDSQATAVTQSVGSNQSPASGPQNAADIPPGGPVTDGQTGPNDAWPLAQTNSWDQFNPGVSDRPETPSFNGLYYLALAIFIIVAFVRRFYRRIRSAINGPDPVGSVRRRGYRQGSLSTADQSFDPTDDLVQSDGRRQSKNRKGQGNAAPFRVLADGFWIQTERYPRGTVLLYEYRAGGQLHQATVVVEHPTEQFVYTGSEPHSIAIRTLSQQDESNPFGSGRQQEQTDWNSTGTALAAHEFLEDYHESAQDSEDQDENSPEDNNTFLTPGGLRAEAEDPFPSAYS